MYLNKLILKNFKKYRYAEVEFQDGLTGIVGPNGAGKSTIVEAIAWALYGKKASTIKKDQLKNVNADESDTVEVQLSMGIMRGQDLTIRRSMKGKSRKTDATLFRDGTIIAYGSNEVDQKLEELLHINYEDFMKTFYARQKDLDNLLKEGGADKREYLLKLLGLDDIKERSKDRIKSDKSKLIEQKNKIEGALMELAGLEAKLEGVIQDIHLAMDEFSGSVSKQKEALTLVAAREDELKVHRERRRYYDQLSERISGIEQSITEKRGMIKSDIDSLTEINGLKILLDNLAPSIKRLEIIKSQLCLLEPKRTEYEELSKRLTRARASLEGAKRILNGYEERLSSLIKDQSELEEIRPIETEYIKILEDLQKLGVQRDRYSELQMHLKGESIKLDSANLDISKLEYVVRELSNSKSRMKEIEPYKIEYLDHQKELEKANSQREKKKEFDILTEQKANLETRKYKLFVESESIKQDISSLEDLAVIESELRNQNQKEDKRRSEIQNSISELKRILAIQEDKLSDSSKNLARVIDLGSNSTCPTCERPLGEHCNDLLRKYDQEKSSANDQIIKLNDEIQVHVKEFDKSNIIKSDLERSSEELNAQKNKKSALIASQKSIDDQMSVVTSEVNTLSGRIDLLGDIQFDLEIFQKMQSSMEKLGQFTEEYNNIAAKLEELPKKDDDLKRLKEEQQRHNREAEKLSNDLDALGYSESNYRSLLKKSADYKPKHEKFIALSQKIQEIPMLEESIQSELDENSILSMSINDLNIELNAIGFDMSVYNAFQKELKSLSKDEENAQKIRAQLTSEPGIIKRRDENLLGMVKLEKALDEAKKNIIDIKYSETHFRAAEKALVEAKNNHEEARKDKSDKEIRLRVLEETQIKLQEEAIRKESYQKDLTLMGELLQVNKIVEGFIDSFMKQVLISIKDDIACSAGKILEQISGKYNTVNIDDDLNIFVEDEGRPYPAIRFSGGEIDMIAISVRVAISEYLRRSRREDPGYSFLILDEIFGSQDQEHRDNMIATLRGLEERFPQIIVISHISDINGQFDNTINVIQNEAGNSIVKEI